MYDVATNPIPKNNFFGTPRTLEDLLKFIESMPKEHRANAMMASQLALNWAHMAVQDEILSKEIFAG